MLPLMVGGAPRSGTTFLGDVLARCSNGILATPESQFKVDVLKRREQLSAEGYLDLFRTHPRFELWPIEARTVRLDGSPWDHPVARAMGSVLNQYASSLGRPSPSVWLDHTPNNVRHFLLLREIFPGAKLIHLVRDPRAVCASVLRVDWGPLTARHAAQMWIAHVASGLAMESVCGPSTVLRIHYEDLIHRPDETSGKILEWADVDRTDDATGVELPSFYHDRYHALVGAGPDRSRVDAWRSELSSKQTAIVEDEVADLLAALGYEPSIYPHPYAASVLTRSLEYLAEAVLRPVRLASYRAALTRHRRRRGHDPRDPRE